MFFRKICASVICGHFIKDIECEKYFLNLSFVKNHATIAVMHEKFLSPYKPEQTEGRIYELWEKSGFLEVRRRLDVPFGIWTKTVRVMVKPVREALINARFFVCP